MVTIKYALIHFKTMMSIIVVIDDDEVMCVDWSSWCIISELRPPKALRSATGRLSTSARQLHTTNVCFQRFQKSHFLLGMLQENRNKLETEGTWCHGFPIKRPTALLASMWQFFGNPLKPIFCFRDFMGGLKGKAFEMSFCVVWSMIINWFGLVWVFGSFGGRSWEATWNVVDPS